MDEGERRRGEATRRDGKEERGREKKAQKGIERREDGMGREGNRCR